MFSSPVALWSDPKPTGKNCLQSCGIVKWPKTYWQQLRPVWWHCEVIKKYRQQLPQVLWHWEVIQNLLATITSSPVALRSDPKPTANNCLQSCGIVKWCKTNWQQLPPVLWHYEVIQNLLTKLPPVLWHGEVIQNLLATIAFSPVALQSDPKPTGNNCLQFCGTGKWSKTYWQQLPSVLWHFEVIQNLLATIASSLMALWSDPKPTGNNCLQSCAIVK